MTLSTNADGAVLVPAGGYEATYQCIRSLGKRGISTIGAASGPVPGFSSRYCDEVVSVPDPSEDFGRYRDALFELVERRDITTIIPCREEDAYLLSKYRDAFEDHVSLVVPTLAELEWVHDRAKLFAAAERAGVPAPETRLLTEVDEWRGQRVIKPRYNLLTPDYLDTVPAGTVEEINTIVHPSPGETPDRCAIRATMKHDPIVQEYVPKDDEYMFAGLYDHGEPLVTFQHRQIRGNSYVGGGGVYRKSVYIEELERVARSLLAHLEWHGLACIEYIKDARTGEFKLVEINPRMWQSLPATVRAGADIPHHYWLRAMGRPEAIRPGYDVGVGCHRLNGEVGYLLSLFTDESPHVARPPLHSALWDIATSCLTQPHFDHLHLDDPVPFFRGVYQFLTPNRDESESPQQGGDVVDVEDTAADGEDEPDAPTQKHHTP